MPCTVEVRGQGHALLRALVPEGLPRVRAALGEAGLDPPRHVEREFAGFEACGQPEYGYAWLLCRACEHHRLVTFSCKGRGFCPSCGGRRMAERAGWWVDRVFPRVGVRQWVLTVPWSRRWLLARRPELARGVLRIALDEVERWYRKRSGRPNARGGSITVLQRFGSALNLNLHFHALVLDGVFVPTRRGGVSFRRASPTTADVEDLVAEIADRCEAWLATQGYGPDEDVAPEDDDPVGLIQAASLNGRLLTSRRTRKVKRTQVLGGREHALPAKTASCAGYNLSAGVYVPARDRVGLERLARYVLRPPLAKARLERRADGTVVLGLKRAWSDGTTALELSASELVERLVAIIPPPRANQVIYRGVLAADAGLRRKVVPKPREARPERKLVKEAGARPRADRAAWSTLLSRVFGVDGFACPTCRGPMVLRTVVVGPVSGEILSDLVRSTGVLRATGPP